MEEGGETRNAEELRGAKDAQLKAELRAFLQKTTFELWNNNNVLFLSDIPKPALADFNSKSLTSKQATTGNTKQVTTGNTKQVTNGNTSEDLTLLRPKHLLQKLQQFSKRRRNLGKSSETKHEKNQTLSCGSGDFMNLSGRNEDLVGKRRRNGKGKPVRLVPPSSREGKAYESSTSVVILQPVLQGLNNVFEEKKNGILSFSELTFGFSSWLTKFNHD